MVAYSRHGDYLYRQQTTRTGRVDHYCHVPVSDLSSRIVHRRMDCVRAPQEHPRGDFDWAIRCTGHLHILFHVELDRILNTRMTVKYPKINFLDLFFDLIFLAVCVVATIGYWSLRLYIQTLVFGGFTLFTGWGLANGLRLLRPNTSFEKLSIHLFIMSVGIFVVGGLIAAFSGDALRANPILGSALLVVWLGMLLYLGWRMDSTKKYEQHLRQSEQEKRITVAQQKPTAVDLVSGKTYRVIAAFKDYDGIVHPVGESWRFVKKSFLPYEDGLTLIIEMNEQEVWIRLQWRPETQGQLIDNFFDYVEQV